MKIVYLSHSLCPESCWHIVSAIKTGAPSVLTYCKSQNKAKANRRHSTSHIPTVKGCDRDEYPFACTYEGGYGANVMHINSSDNRRAGAIIGSQLRGLPDGTKFVIVITYQKSETALAHGSHLFPCQRREVRKIPRPPTFPNPPPLQFPQICSTLIPLYKKGTMCEEEFQ